MIAEYIHGEETRMEMEDEGLVELKNLVINHQNTLKSLASTTVLFLFFIFIFIFYFNYLFFIISDWKYCRSIKTSQSWKSSIFSSTLG